MINMDRACFQLALTAWFAYLGMYHPNSVISVFQSDALKTIQFNVKAIWG